MRMSSGYHFIGKIVIKKVNMYIEQSIFVVYGQGTFTMKHRVLLVM